MKNCRIENCFLEDQPLYLQIGTLINSWYLCFYTQYIITNRNRPYDMHPLMMSKLLINGKIRFDYLICTICKAPRAKCARKDMFLNMFEIT